jgi:hypothetical protein
MLFVSFDSHPKMNHTNTKLHLDHNIMWPDEWPGNLRLLFEITGQLSTEILGISPTYIRSKILQSFFDTTNIYAILKKLFIICLNVLRNLVCGRHLQERTGFHR